MIELVLSGILIGYSLSSLVWYSWAKKHGWVKWYSYPKTKNQEAKEK